MQKSKLHLEFDIGFCRGKSMGMRILVNGVLVDQATVFTTTVYVLDLDVSMPLKVVFQLYNKDLNKDTIVSADGVILEDKFVRLSRAVLGGVEIPEHVLIQTFDCDFARDQQKRIYWGEPGTVTMSIADENIVSWHLKTLIEQAW